uniref:Uncharacterized protein n=1 Tax=Sphaerodactylus townsendi TaxID=933632 RepID=A0ACB8GB41_9SAUR
MEHLEDQLALQLVKEPFLSDVDDASNVIPVQQLAAGVSSSTDNATLVMGVGQACNSKPKLPKRKRCGVAHKKGLKKPLNCKQYRSSQFHPPGKLDRPALETEPTDGEKEEEISRVRKDMYNDTLNGSTEKRSAELPDAVGPIVQLQEKLYVPVKEYPDVSLPPTAHLRLNGCRRDVGTHSQELFSMDLGSSLPLPDHFAQRKAKDKSTDRHMESPLALQKKRCASSSWSSAPSQDVANLGGSLTGFSSPPRALECSASDWAPEEGNQQLDLSVCREEQGPSGGWGGGELTEAPH